MKNVYVGKAPGVSLLLLLICGLLAGCVGSPVRPYTVNKIDNINKINAPSSISINGLNEFPEMRERLIQTLEKGGLIVDKSNQSTVVLNVMVDKGYLYAYEQADILPYQLGIGVGRVPTGRDMLVRFDDGGYKNLVWTERSLPINPFFISRPMNVELIFGSKRVFNADGEYIVSQDSPVKADSFFYLYPDRITENYLPCACLVALGHYDLLKNGAKIQKRYMLYWIGQYGCIDAKPIVENTMNSDQDLKVYCEKILNDIK
jgi:hypothetical protein